MFYDCKNLMNIDGIIFWKINTTETDCIFNNNKLEKKEIILSIFGENSIC